MKYTDLKFHDTYFYEVRENGSLYCTYDKYEGALSTAIDLYSKGHTDVVVVSRRARDFALTTSEEIKGLIDEDILTFQVDDVEYEVSEGRSGILNKLAELMKKYEIASFKLDLKEFTLKDGVHFVRREGN